MSSNPFSNLNENPFADPSAHNPPRNANDVLEGYNPLAEDSRRPATGPVRGATNPPIMPTTNDPPPAYHPSAAQTATTLPGQDDLLRRQQELERKEAELRRREQNLAQGATGGERPNNWPPLPQWSPVGPCFYQDIDVEIPSQFQKVVKQVYYLWMLYTATLFLNFIGALAGWIGGGYSATLFGMSILQLALFTPCSFLLWYRPLYKAFRSDSSLNFMVFFFVMFAQIVFAVVQAIGLDSFGTCGWVNTIAMFGHSIGAGVVMLLPAIGFSSIAAGTIISLMQVHRIYRGAGGSFSVAKAREEFGRDVTTNPTFQTAAAGVATSAVQSQMGGGGAGGRY